MTLVSWGFELTSWIDTCCSFIRFRKGGVHTPYSACLRLTRGKSQYSWEPTRRQTRCSERNWLALAQCLQRGTWYIGGNLNMRKVQSATPVLIGDMTCGVLIAREAYKSARSLTAFRSPCPWKSHVAWGSPWQQGYHRYSNTKEYTREGRQYNWTAQEPGSKTWGKGEPERENSRRWLYILCILREEHDLAVTQESRGGGGGGY